MLHCRGAVAALVARWRAGPWVGRLDMPAAALLVFTAVDTLSKRAGGKLAADAADVAAAKARFAQWAPTDQDLRRINTPESLACLNGELKCLQPHQPGGGRSLLLYPSACLPPAAWQWLRALEEHLAVADGDEIGTGKHGSWRDARRRARTQMADAVPVSDGAAAVLSEAGGELVAVAQPCNVRDVCMLFGPYHTRGEVSAGCAALVSQELAGLGWVAGMTSFEASRCVAVRNTDCRVLMALDAAARQCGENVSTS
jgi:hypothetical protein